MPAKRISAWVFLFLFSFTGVIKAQNFSTREIHSWEKQAKQVTISRDKWDVPHIHGKTDADAVFGLIYSQCEDDFERVERNYIGVLGRLAEIDGPDAVFVDLRQRLFIDSVQAIKLYKICPVFLKKLMQAWANGMNYYLFKNPQKKPLLITRYQPWMPLLFSEGSIGGDISQVSARRIESFYSGKNNSDDEGHLLPLPETRGSNGIAIAPSHTANGNALLLINPHTSYYFRSEVHMSSDEGLNVYGAVTWGQFFVYQGFNENCGWMHTSCFTDVIDEYAEQVEQRADGYVYMYEGKWKKVDAEKVTIRYKNEEGKISNREFTVYRTHHGPVAGKKGDKWITVKLMNEPVKALMQSFLRTKSNGYDSYKKNMQLKANSSNNTVFADKSGNIAFWQGNFVPRRKDGVDPSGQLDGAVAQTEWQGLHNLDEIIHFKNPACGWLQNCNSSPYWATGNKKDMSLHPPYMGPDKQNYRAVHAINLLKSDSLFTLEKLNAAAYDAHLPAFDVLIPSLLEAIKTIAISESTDHLKLKQAYQLFEAWNDRFSVSSTETTLAVFWAYKLLRKASGKWRDLNLDEIGMMDFMAEKTTDLEKTDLLLQTMDELEKDFGSWKVAWGEVNRFQRLTGKVNETYDDNKTSWSVPFATAIWGSLATMDAKRFSGTKRQYGESGNSFVAIVEFGKKIRAKTISSGGHSSNPASPHFNNQAEMFCRGELKDVVFYPEEISASAVRVYYPGE